jgi:hypothetical protein
MSYSWGLLHLPISIRPGYWRERLKPHMAHMDKSAELRHALTLIGNRASINLVIR